MDQADQQDRFCCIGRPTCGRMSACVTAPQPGPVQRQAAPTRGQRLLAAATIGASLSVGLNALVQALNVLAAWWSHGR